MIYHGSNNKFDLFNLELMQTTSQGYGIYFGDIELASQYAYPYLYGCEVEGKSLQKTLFKIDFIIKLINKLPIELQTLLIDNYGYEVLNNNNIIKIAKDLKDNNDNNIDLLCCLINSLSGNPRCYAKAVYKALYTLTGATHAKVTTERGVNMTIVFVAEKIKIVELKPLESVKHE
jgi:hypothetical protein